MKRETANRLVEGIGVAALVAVLFYPLGDGALVDHDRSWASQFELWFFDTRGSSEGLVVLIAAWLGWRRFPVKTGGAATHYRVQTAFFFSSAFFVYTWACLNDAGDLMFIAAALIVAACGAFLNGWAGVRRLLPASVVLLFAIPFPSPFINEVFWFLQNTSAVGAAKLLTTLGYDMHRSGAELAGDDVSFLVIEGCSGLRSMLTLTLSSIVIRELVAGKGLRGWTPVLLAPLLALGLNVVRIAAIVISTTPGNQNLGDKHTEQGIVVILMGSILLFAMSHLLAPRRAENRSRARESTAVGEQRTCTHLLAASVFSFLLVRTVVEPWPVEPSLTRPLELAGSTGQWTSESLQPDFQFLGILPRGHVERRIFNRDRPLDRLGRRPVELLVVHSHQSGSRMSPVSSKLLVPGRDWQITERRSVYNYALGQEIERVVTKSSKEQALVYAWTRHDRGLILGSIRSLLALDRGPFARHETPLMIRVASEIGVEPEAELHAQKILDRFVHDFRDPLRAL